MFSKLTDFGVKRDTQQAVGFYLAYLVAIIVIAMIAAVLVAPIGGGYLIGVRVGSNVAVVGSLVLSFLVLQKKNLLNDFKFLLIGLLAGLLAFFGGGVLGLIPVAYLTTL